MLHQVQAVPQNPDLPHQALSSSNALYEWDSIAMDHGGTFHLPFSSLLFHFTKSNAPS